MTTYAPSYICKELFKKEENSVLRNDKDDTYTYLNQS